MGWEQRGNKLVYYRKARGKDGSVRSIYCGSGERGRQAEREDAERRAVNRSIRVAHGENSRESETSSDSPVEEGTPLSVERDGVSPPCATNGADVVAGFVACAADVTPAPLTPEEIISRGRAPWPHSLQKSREAFLRLLLDRGMTTVACRSAGIADRELQKRGFRSVSLPESLPNPASGPSQPQQSVDAES